MQKKNKKPITWNSRHASTIQSTHVLLKKTSSLTTRQLNEYQQQSIKAQRYSQKFILPIFKSLNKRLKLLDVGALDGQTYRKYSFIQPISIDLNPQSPLVQKQDFLKRPLPTSNEDRFDACCLALVINFCPNPADRGLMIARSWDFLLPDGILYVSLPLPCVKNSRYLTHEHFFKIVEACGFRLLNHHHSPRIAYYCFQKSSRSIFPEFRKIQLNPGASRNNFCITLDCSTFNHAIETPITLSES